MPTKRPRATTRGRYIINRLWERPLKPLVLPKPYPARVYDAEGRLIATVDPVTRRRTEVS